MVRPFSVAMSILWFMRRMRSSRLLLWCPACPSGDTTSKSPMTLTPDTLYWWCAGAPGPGRARDAVSFHPQR